MPACPGYDTRSEQKTGRRNPPSETPAPPRAVISSARAWKKSSSRGGRIPTASSSCGERSVRSSPRGRPVGEGKTPSPYPWIGRSPRDRDRGCGSRGFHPVPPPPPREPHRYWHSGWKEPRVFECRHARCVVFRRGHFPIDLKWPHRPIARVVLEHSRVVQRSRTKRPLSVTALACFGSNW